MHTFLPWHTIEKAHSSLKMHINAYSNIQHLQWSWGNILLSMISFSSIIIKSITMYFYMSTHIVFMCKPLSVKPYFFVRSTINTTRWSISIIITPTPPIPPPPTVALLWLIVVLHRFSFVAFERRGRARYSPRAASRYHFFAIERWIVNHIHSNSQE